MRVSGPFRSPILQGGVLVWLIGILGWILLWEADRGQAIAAAATLGAFLTAGKVVAITAGLSLQGQPWIVGTTIFLSDFGALLFLYPFTRQGIHQLGRWSQRIRKAVEKAQARHQNQQGFIARHGPWGLFAVSLIPVGFYSPLIISALGQVLGFRARQILWPVGAAMLVMTTAWTMTLNASLDTAAQLDPRLPFVLSLGLLGLFLAKNVVQFLWNRRRPAPGPIAKPDELTD